MTVSVMVVMFLVGMRSGHCVVPNAWEVSSAVVIAVRVVWELTRATVVRKMCGQSALSLDLGGSSGKEVDVEVLSIVGASSQTSAVRVETGRESRV